MKSCATGLSVRVCKVTMPTGTGAIGSLTGKTLISARAAERATRHAGKGSWQLTPCGMHDCVVGHHTSGISTIQNSHRVGIPSKHDSVSTATAPVGSRNKQKFRALLRSEERRVGKECR